MDGRKEAIPNINFKDNFSLTSSLRSPYGGLNKNAAWKQILKKINEILANEKQLNNKRGF